MAWVKLADEPGQKIDSESGNFYYWKIEDGFVWHQRRKLKKADRDSFEVWLGSEHSKFVGRDKDNIYYAWTLKKDIDRASFQSLSNGYWRDKNHAYCEYETSIKPLKGADSSRFRFIGGPYAADCRVAYYAGRIMKSCLNPSGLELMDSSDSWYVGDGERVFFDGAQLKGAIYKDWELLGEGYSRDSQSVYFGSKKLGRANIERWSLVAEKFSKDDKSVYYMCFKIKGADAGTWEHLAYSYSKDQNHLYFGNKPIEGGDLESFEVTGDNTAKDKNNLFMYGQIVRPNR